MSRDFVLKSELFFLGHVKQTTWKKVNETDLVMLCSVIYPIAGASIILVIDLAGPSH